MCGKNNLYEIIVTVLCQRATPPKADIKYMMVMAICTSVTSILQRHHVLIIIIILSAEAAMLFGK